MPRYIDADTVVKRLDEIQPFAGNKAANAAINLCKDIVRNAPTISTDEVRGVWIEDRMDYKCSVCGKAVKDEIVYMLDPYQLPSFCPNCGAKMEVSEDA